MWDAFGCETIADYHDVYLQLDVLLLVDFFEKFRRTCLDFYSLDPLHYYTTPGLAWDVALRMSRVELELITDENIYNLIENSIRGRISMISTATRELIIHHFHLHTMIDFQGKTYSIWMQIIYMVVPCHNFYPHMDFDSYPVMRSLHWN